MSPQKKQHPTEFEDCFPLKNIGNNGALSNHEIFPQETESAYEMKATLPTRPVGRFVLERGGRPKHSSSLHLSNKKRSAWGSPPKRKNVFLLLLLLLLLLRRRRRRRRHHHNNNNNSTGTSGSVDQAVAPTAVSFFLLLVFLFFLLRLPRLFRPPVDR